MYYGVFIKSIMWLSYFPYTSLIGRPGLVRKYVGFVSLFTSTMSTSPSARASRKVSMCPGWRMSKQPLVVMTFSPSCLSRAISLRPSNFLSLYLRLPSVFTYVLISLPTILTYPLRPSLIFRTLEDFWFVFLPLLSLFRFLRKSLW